MAYLKVITGPMFSGKTEELIRLLHRSLIAEKRILVVKPHIDTRSNNEIVSRKKGDPKQNGFSKFLDFPAVAISTPEELAELLEEKRPQILALDETQFFDSWIVEFLQSLLRSHASSDLIIYAAGLDMDAWGKPFGQMPAIMAIADEVQKETAVCFACKMRPGVITQKLTSSTQTVEVGDSEIYEARCRECHTLPNKTPNTYLTFSALRQNTKI
jgi:thymidine kinase